MLGFLTEEVDMFLEELAQETGFCKGKDWKRSRRGNASITSREIKASRGMAAYERLHCSGSEGKEGYLHGIVYVHHVMTGHGT